MSLYIITHKYLDKTIEKDGYKYLYVGAYKQPVRRNKYLFDDEGIEISHKNSNYCELTGMYWLWNNSSDERKGIAHYRRFFTKNSFSINPFYYYSSSELDKMLDNYDILVAEKLYVPDENIYRDYQRYHYKKDIDELRHLIAEKYGEYKEAFDIVFSRNYYSPANMIYCKASIFNSYCEWLFSVLGDLESRIDITEYNIEQARIYGFLGERLLNVWIEKNNLKKKELRIIQTDSRFRLRVRKKLDSILKKAITKKQKYSK